MIFALSLSPLVGVSIGQSFNTRTTMETTDTIKALKKKSSEQQITIICAWLDSVITVD
jgi:hypothetical protein